MPTHWERKKQLNSFLKLGNYYLDTLKGDIDKHPIKFKEKIEASCFNFFFIILILLYVYSNTLKNKNY